MEIYTETEKIIIPETHIDQFELLKTIKTTDIPTDKLTYVPNNNIKSLNIFLNAFLINDREITDIEVLNNLNSIEETSNFLIWMNFSKFLVSTLKLIKNYDESELVQYFEYFENDLTNIYKKISTIDDINIIMETTNISPFLNINDTTKCEEFKNKINNLINFKLNWTDDMIIAGGLVIGLLDEKYLKSESDLDIWLLNSDNENQTIKYILENMINRHDVNFVCIIDENIVRIFIEDDDAFIKHIQIINTKCTTPEEILFNFDFDVCKMGICKNHLCFNYSGLVQIKKTQMIVYNSQKNRLRRIKKYMERGFNPVYEYSYDNTKPLILSEFFYENIMNQRSPNPSYRTIHEFVRWFKNLSKIGSQKHKKELHVCNNFLPKNISLSYLTPNIKFSQYIFVQNDAKYDDNIHEYTNSSIEIIKNDKIIINNLNLFKINDLTKTNIKYYCKKINYNNVTIVVKYNDQNVCDYFEIFHKITVNLNKYEFTKNN